MKNILDSVINFVFPGTCAACGACLSAVRAAGDGAPGAPGALCALCAPCAGSIEFIKPLYCRKCGVPLPFGGAHCYNCLHPSGKKYYELLRGVCVYDGVMRKCVHMFKYGGKDYLSGFLGGLLAGYISSDETMNAAELLVPVPLHPYRRFMRGYNQSELLAREAARRTGKKLLKNALARERHTKSQAKLDRSSRIENVRGAFAVKNPSLLKGRAVIVVDDVCTTGETINQCAKALSEAGASAVYGLVVARES